MNQLEYQREVCAYDEKIALGKLEVAKAEERVKELEFQKARFILEIMVAQIKTQPVVPQAAPV